MSATIMLGAQFDGLILNCFFPIGGNVEFPIVDFDSLDILKKDGLLLLFGDGTLEVKSGKREVLFSYCEGYEFREIDYVNTAYQLP